MNFFVRFFLLIFFGTALLHADTLIDTKLENRALKKYGVFAKNRFVDIKSSLIGDLHSASTMRKLNTVNTWVNYIHYKSDMANYGVSDYWATLYEFVGRNAGDCEDYTIAKYYILKDLGVDPHRMKFAYVIYLSRTGRHISHMVLAYFKVARPKSKDDILILGNNNRLVLPASKRPDLIRMVKMINGDTGPKSRKWRQLEANMKRKKL